jgi:hypothetical protein
MVINKKCKQIFAGEVYGNFSRRNIITSSFIMDWIKLTQDRACNSLFVHVCLFLLTLVAF